MSKGSIFGLGILAIIILSFFCINSHAKRIESDLYSQSVSALTMAGMTTDGLSFSGRDAKVVGVSQGFLDRAREIVGNVYGVRRVVTEFTGDVELTRLMPWLHLNLKKGMVELSGILPDMDAKSGLLEKAREHFGEMNLVDKIEINQDASGAMWLGKLVSMLPMIRSQIETGKIEIGGNDIKLMGEVASREVKDKIASDVTASFPTLNLLNELTWKAPDMMAWQAELKNLFAVKKIQFYIDSEELTAAGAAVLDEVLDLAMNKRAFNIKIEGHADSQGNDAYNLDLSQRRSETVRNYLVGHGVPASRLTSTGFGETKPVASNATREGRRKNRRVEFILSEMITAK